MAMEILYVETELNFCEFINYHNSLAQVYGKWWVLILQNEESKFIYVFKN